MGVDYKKIIIVDDSEIYRAGLRGLIDRHSNLKVVAEAECGDKAIEAIKKYPADLVLSGLEHAQIHRLRGFAKNQGDFRH